ncbi:MAG: hypothetical protein M3Z75_29690, partial [Actinomycetota bacterium]|nr:hypothetical protein [Actinomycetota bacterium]
VKRRPELFAGRVTCFGRNFPGHELITAILDAGGHVVARAGLLCIGHGTADFRPPGLQASRARDRRHDAAS